MRTLPEPVSEASRWLLVCGLAFCLADAASATIEQRLAVAPAPLGKVTLPAPTTGAQAPSELVKLLSVTEPAAVASSGPSVQPRQESSKPAEGQLSVTLVGCMAGGGGSGLAMLTMGGDSLAVSPGEPVADWTVLAVYPTSVALERNGKQETLQLNEPAQLATASTVSSAAPATSAAVAQPAAAPATPPQADPTPSGPVEPLTSRKELLSILDNDMAKITRQGRVKSVVRDGEVFGMELGIKDPNFPLARLGLLSGDIVTSLNGVEVRGPQDMGKLLGTLRNSNTLKFELERQGQKTTHTVELEY